MPVFKTARGALLGSLARAVQMPPDRRRAANEAQAPLRGWAGFRQRHLFDYNPAATRFWLVLAASGGMAASVSLLMVLRLPAVEWMQILAWTVVVGIAAAFPIEGKSVPGTVLASPPVVACGEGALALTRLQRAGGKPMDAAAFANGFDLPPGTVL